MTIRSRILIAVLIVVVVSSGLHAFYVLHHERSEALAHLRATVQEMDHRLAIVLAHPLVEGDMEELELILDSFFLDRNLTALSLSGKAGLIQLRRDRPPLAGPGSTLESRVVIGPPGAPVGEVRSTYSTALMEQGLAESRNRFLAFSVGLVLALSFVIYLVASGLARPLARLNEVAQAMADGDLDRRLEVHGARELVSLAGSFLRLREDVYKRQV